jgi:hypothetical protein
VEFRSSHDEGVRRGEVEEMLESMTAMSRRRFLRYAALTAGLATVSRLRAPRIATAGAAAVEIAVLEPGEVTVLSAIVERMVASGDPAMPSVAETKAIATIDAALRTLDPSVVSQLRWLLTLFEYGPPALSFRFATFTRLSPDAQDEYIRGWATSRFEIRRLAFRALKNLSMLGYYAQDATWSGIHYDGPWVPTRRPAETPVA